MAVRRHDPREHRVRPARRATEAEIQAAAEATFVDRFVRSLPDGYDTVIDDEGSNVSAGEKQLITIARAFLADPALLILDEATSSVDTRTEVLVQHAMAALRTDRTSFVIAHRLSTIRDADLILVMDGGRIVEHGTHDELLAATARTRRSTRRSSSGRSPRRRSEPDAAVRADGSAGMPSGGAVGNTQVGFENPITRRRRRGPRCARTCRCPGARRRSTTPCTHLLGRDAHDGVGRLELRGAGQIGDGR